MVIDFGGGGVTAKGRAAVREVTLNEFEDGATGQVVHHPQKFLFGLGEGLPEGPLTRRDSGPGEVPTGLPDSQALTTWWRRTASTWANWAVTGGYFESLQVRRLLYVKAVADMVVFYA